MKVILIEEEAFYELIERVVSRIEDKHKKQSQKWLTPKQAMQALGVKSTTTLQRYRDEGKIRYTQPSKKVILYDPKSIEEFLVSNVKNTY
ncbi:MAG: helix-turn-helix domain-containing protein [Cytophagales bacterium]|nr:helix-turn-helix domain-containing protein [Cytophagales bacterium]